MRRKRRQSKFRPIKGKYQASPPQTEYTPDWRVVNNQSLVLILNFLDGTPEDRARTSMLDFLKRHKKFREKIRKSLIDSFSYIEKESRVKRPKEDIKNAKKTINILAREVW